MDTTSTEPMEWTQQGRDHIIDAGGGFQFYLYGQGVAEEWDRRFLLALAAPALLAACEAVLNSDMAMREEDEGRQSDTLDLVRAAITRARGTELDQP